MARKKIKPDPRHVSAKPNTTAISSAVKQRRRDGSQLTKLIGSRLRLLRLDRGMSIRQLEKLAFVSDTEIIHIEKGKVSPTADTLFKLCKAFQIDASFFFPSWKD